MDGEFLAAQPFKYIPLNYVIDSYEFHQSRDLGKLPFPHLNVLFIGWVPIILAVIGSVEQKGQLLCQMVLYRKHFADPGRQQR